MTVQNESNLAPRDYNKWVVWLALFNSLLGMAAFGYSLAAINIIQDYLTYVIFGWSDDAATTYISWLNSVVTIGACVGSVSGGSLAKHLGRRRSMMMMDIVGTFAIMLTLFPSYPLMLLGRSIAGIYVGFNTVVVSVYVRELAPAQVKGLAGALIQGMVCGGSMLCSGFGLGVPNSVERAAGERNSWWRFILGFPMILTFIRFVVLWEVCPFEPPQYLIMTNQDEAAKLALERIYQGESITLEYEFLKRVREKTSQGNKITYRDLLGPEYRTRFFVGLFIAISQQYVGVNSLVFYSTAVFELILGTENASKAPTLTVIFGFCSLFTALISGSLTINRFGRKTILTYGLVGLAVMQTGIAYCGYTDHPMVMIAGIFTIALLFGLTWGPILWVILPEILPDIGVGISSLVNLIGLFILAQFYQKYYRAIGLPSAFMSFAALSFCAIFVVICCVKETKDLTPQEITKAYNPKFYAKSEEAADSEERTGFLESKAESPEI